jgi:ATP-dependent DNA helicase DinG
MSKSLPSSLACEFLGEKGRLSEILKDYTHREGQEEMLSHVTSAFNDCSTLLVEAGTGIGKSLAYLIAALKWAETTGDVVVIATHTIALQQQLIEKDLPLAIEACHSKVPVVLLKGSRHYLCKRRLQDEQENLSPEIIEWAKRTRSGEFSELKGKTAQDKIGVDRESCTHTRCPFFSECYLFKARKNGEEAKVIITNHSLLFSDLSLSIESGKEGIGTILPEYQHLILDEAHHVEEVATQYFATRISSKKLHQLFSSITGEKGGGKLGSIAQHVTHCFLNPAEIPIVKDLLDRLELYLPHQRKEIGERIFFFFREFSKFFSDESEKVRLLPKHLESSSWNDVFIPELEEVVKSTLDWVAKVEGLESSIASLKESSLTKKCEGHLADIQGFCKKIRKELERLKHFIHAPFDKESVRWVEKHQAGFELVCAKLEVADLLREFLFAKMKTTLLCSATLASKGKFSYLKKRLGIVEAKEKLFDSPYEYKKNLLFCSLKDMPEPSNPTFSKRAIFALEQILLRSEGQAFVLFTSYQMLQAAARVLRKCLSYPLFVQGEEHRSQLLNKFRATKNAVLLGTDSFWEGVDVAGEQLRCVIIVKLPFQAPSDPLFEARCERIEQKGGAPFFDYALPKAVIKFKQGFGRLIRRHEDRGAVICLDPRLTQKGYGRLFSRAVPQGQECVGTLQEVTNRLQEFFQQSSQGHDLHSSSRQHPTKH